MPLLLALVLVLLAASCEPARASGGATPPPPVEPSTDAGLPRDFVRGVNHAHIHRRGHGYGSPASAAEMDRLRAVGVEWLAVTPFGFQPSATSDELVGFSPEALASGRRRGGDPSLTDDDLAQEIALAHARGMKVVLKPHIWANDFWGGKEWHGSVRQSSPEAHARWWRSYRNFALHYARLAERAGADAFCLGTELVRMTTEHPDEWRALVADVRRVFRGPVTYAAHWEREVDAIGFWDALDVVGVSAYFPLAARDEASVDELVAAWAPHKARLSALAARTGKPIVFLELGFRAATGSFRAPWAYEGGVPDEGTQARAYEATFRALSGEPWWRGAFLWKTFTDPARADEGEDAASYSFRGRLAESVVARWFGGGRVGTPRRE